MGVIQFYVPKNVLYLPISPLNKKTIDNVLLSCYNVCIKHYRGDMNGASNIEYTYG
jgi:hypothetical protein